MRFEPTTPHDAARTARARPSLPCGELVWIGYTSYHDSDLPKFDIPETDSLKANYMRRIRHLFSALGLALVAMGPVYMRGSRRHGWSAESCRRRLGLSPEEEHRYGPIDRFSSTWRVKRRTSGVRFGDLG
jgi:hypothetical protein